MKPTTRTLTLRQLLRLALGPATPLRTRLHALRVLDEGVKQAYTLTITAAQ